MTSREVTYFEVGPNGEHLDAQPGIAEAHQTYQRAVHDYVRDNAGVELPAAIPLGEINQYYQDMGYRTPPVIAIDSRNPRSLEVLHEAALSEAAFRLQERSIAGVYAERGDLSIVALNRGNQADQRQINITRTLAHEQAHGGEKVSYQVRMINGRVRMINGRPDITFAGLGFHRLEVTADGTYQSAGLALTEAQAEISATQFASQQGLVQVASLQSAGGLYLPSEYCKLRENGEVTFSAGASPAIALELLTLKDPAIIGLVLDGARSQAKEAELRARLQLLDEAYPGVAEALLGARTDENIMAVGKKVGALLGATPQDILDAHDNAADLLTQRTRAQRVAQAQHDANSMEDVQSSTGGKHIIITRDELSKTGTLDPPVSRENFEDSIVSRRDTIHRAIGHMATNESSVLSFTLEAQDRLDEALEILYAQLGQPGSESFDHYAKELTPLLKSQRLFLPLKQRIEVAARTAQTAAEHL